MLKGLISRIFRPGAARAGLPLNNNVAAASERQCTKPVSSPSGRQKPRQRDGPALDQSEAVEPARLLNSIAVLQQRYRRDMDFYHKTASAQSGGDAVEADVSAHIECIRKTTGYTFKDPALVRGAIFRDDVHYKGRVLSRATQLQLAKLGDELFKSVHYATNFPATAIGTEIGGREWSWVTSNATLHFAAQRLGLPQMLAESGHATKIQGDHDKGFGTMMEALVGAVYMDSGEDGAVTRTTMARLLGTSMERQELQRYYKRFRTKVFKPNPRLYWHTMRDKANAHAQVQHEEQFASSDAHVESALQDWADKVRKLKRDSRRQLKRTRRRGTLLHGSSLRNYIELVKNRAARAVKKHKRTGVGERRKAAMRREADSMLEWVEEAEERLRQGEEFHKL